MANRVEEHDADDELAEILRRAIRKDSGSDADLRRRLLAAADELGISHAAVVEAESEYRRESSLQRELALFTKETRNALRIHAGVFVIVNLFMVGLNLLTLSKDHEIWFPYVLLSWGVGLAIHAFVAMRKIDADDEEFQQWREKRAEG